VLWLQYALLDRGWPAIAKGVAVFAATVVASLAMSALTDWIVASSGALLARRAPWLVGH
jgi:hypothetical protein